MTRPRALDALAFLVLTLLLLVIFFRLAARPDGLIVDGERASLDYNQRDDPRVVGNDLTSLFLPHNAHVAAQVRRLGRVPGWDARGFAGRPMIGNPQGGLFYPPVWLAWGARTPSALGWLTVGHLLLGGWGVYVLARGLRMGRPAATVAAGCFEASPFLVAQTFEGHYPHVWAACWYPWAFWAFLRLRQGDARGALWLPPILALMFLAGHPQEGYYLVFTLSVWTLYDALRAARSNQWRRSAVTILAWGGLVGLSLGLVAVELLPDMAAQAWMPRGGRVGNGTANRYLLHVNNLWQLLSPAALGGPAEYFGNDNYWETVLSIGLAPLVLVMVAVAYHRDRTQTRAWLALILSAVVFAGGRKLGLFAVLADLVPGMNRFRVPARALFLANLGAAVLAGLGVEALGRLATDSERWERFHRQARRGATIVASGLLVGLAVAWSVPARLPTPPDPSGPYVFGRLAMRNGLGEADRFGLAATQVVQSGAFWFALGGTALALTLARLGRPRFADRRGAVVAAALGAIALAELGWQGAALVQVAPADRFLGRDPISAALAKAEPPVAGPFRVRTRDLLYPDLSAWSNGFEKVNINDWFQIGHAADLYQTLYPLLYAPLTPNAAEPMSAPAARAHAEIRQGVLDRLGVAFLVSDRVEAEPVWRPVSSGTWRGLRFTVHANPTVLPRAYVVPRAFPADGDASTLLPLFRVIDARQAVILPADPLPAIGPRQAFRTASYASADPYRVTVRVATEAPGLLVIADTWMPGWTARVDGRPVPILRGNLAQRVVPLPDVGTHKIVLTYSPPGFALGLAFTGFSALAWLVLRFVSPSVSKAKRAFPDRDRPSEIVSKQGPARGVAIGLTAGKA